MVLNLLLHCTYLQAIVLQKTGLSHVSFGLIQENLKAKRLLGKSVSHQTNLHALATIFLFFGWLEGTYALLDVIDLFMLLLKSCFAVC